MDKMVDEVLQTTNQYPLITIKQRVKQIISPGNVPCLISYLLQLLGQREALAEGEEVHQDAQRTHPDMLVAENSSITDRFHSLTLFTVEVEVCI